MEKMHRAYSLITVKRLDAERRTFSGWATRPEPDRMGDTVNPLGATFANPLVLLHQHDSKRPIGTVKFDKPTKDGITFTAEIPVITDPGTLKDRVDTAWGEIEAGVVNAVSIGFRPKKYAFNDAGGVDFQEVEILELSTVSVPAHAGAVITSVGAGKKMDVRTMAALKAADVGLERASKVSRVVRLQPAGGAKGRVVKLDAPTPGAANASRVVALDGSHRWKGARLTATDRQEIAALKSVMTPGLTAADRAEIAELKKRFDTGDNVRVIALSAEELAAARRRGRS